MAGWGATDLDLAPSLDLTHVVARANALPTAAPHSAPILQLPVARSPVVVATAPLFPTVIRSSRYDATSIGQRLASAMHRYATQRTCVRCNAVFVELDSVGRLECAVHPCAPFHMTSIDAKCLHGSDATWNTDSGRYPCCNRYYAWGAVAQERIYYPMEGDIERRRNPYGCQPVDHATLDELTTLTPVVEYAVLEDAVVKYFGGPANVAIEFTNNVHRWDGNDLRKPARVGQDLVVTKRIFASV